MRTIPQIITNPSPAGADLAIQSIQQELANLELTINGFQELYFDSGLIFGLAKRDERENKPILYWKGNDYFEPFFDNYKASCFFYEEDPRIANQGYQIFNLNLVVLYQPFLYKRNLDYLFQENFIQQVINGVFRRALDGKDFESIRVFTDSISVFSNYGFIKENSVFKPDKFSCFRINFQNKISIDCDTLSL